MLKLHVTGVGDAFTERYHNACLCIEEPSSGLRLHIDCPPAFPRVLADHRARSGSDLAVDNIDHLLLTHLHGDHCGGTEAYLYLRRFVVGRKPTLYGAPEVLDALWPTRLAGGMDRLLLAAPSFDESAVLARFADSLNSSTTNTDKELSALSDNSIYIDSQIREREMIESPGPMKTLGLLDYTDRVDLLPTQTRIGPLRIERRFTRHHIPTTAIRVFLDGRARPLFGYSADTAFDPDLIAWLAEADLVVHETNFGVHTPLSALMTVPQSVRNRMRLIHYPDMLDVESSPIPCLREGQVLTLG